MNKYTSGSISMKVNNNNQYNSWAIIDSSDKGIGIGLYKDNSGISSVYLSFNKNYIFGNDLLTLYSIDYNANLRHTIKYLNADINMDVNSTIYTNYLR